MLHADSVISRSPAPWVVPADDELLMLDPQSGAYFSLDVRGRRVWELLEQPRAVADVVCLLIAEYDAPSEVIEADVIRFVRQLADKGLVDVHDPS